jgi:hypothetical protein
MEEPAGIGRERVPDESEGDTPSLSSSSPGPDSAAVGKELSHDNASDGDSSPRGEFEPL